MYVTANMIPWSLPTDPFTQFRVMPDRWIRPPDKVFLTGHPQEIPLGLGETSTGEWKPIGLPYPSLRFPMWITAPMGRGKSALLMNIIASVIKSGAGVGVVDCKASDLVNSVAPLVPLDREKDVVIVTIEPTLVTGYPTMTAFNLLWPDMVKSTGLDSATMASALINIFYVLDPNIRSAAGIQQFLTMGMLALLGGEPQPTLLHLLRLFHDEEYRERLCQSLPPSLSVVQDFWLRRFPEMPTTQKNSLSAFERRLDPLISNPNLRNMLVAPGCSIDMRSAMDRNGIVLFGISAAIGYVGQLAATLFLNQLWFSAMSRSRVPEDQRPDWPLIVDEVQIVAASNEEILKNMLAQLRSMRIGQCYVHQGLSQLPSSVLGPLQDNAAHRIILGCEAADASRYAAIYGGQSLTARDFMSMEVHPKGGYALHAYVRLQGSNLFSMRPLKPPVVVDDPPYPDVYEDWRFIRALPRNAQDQRWDEIMLWLNTLPEEDAIRHMSEIAKDPAAWESFRARSAAHREAQYNFIVRNPGVIPSNPAIRDPERRAADRKLRRIQILSALRSNFPTQEINAWALRLFLQKEERASIAMSSSGHAPSSTKSGRGTRQRSGAKRGTMSDPEAMSLDDVFALAGS